MSARATNDAKQNALVPGASASVGINDFRTAGVAIGSRGSMVFRVLVDGVKK